jgi:hypothetical protein
MIARKLLIFVTAVLLVMTVACSSSGLDDGSSANVVIEVDTVELEIITSTFDPLNAVCVFEITESTATLSNIPKSGSAITEPFNDVLINQMIISYEWDDGYVMDPYVTFPRVVIPANGSNDVKFLAVKLADFLAAAPSRDGHSAEVHLLFNGEVADGNTVQAVGGGALFVNSCIATPGP